MRRAASTNLHCSTVLKHGPGYLVLNKPAGRQVVSNERGDWECDNDPSRPHASLSNSMDAEVTPSQPAVWRALGSLDDAASGALFVATSQQVADEGMRLWSAHGIAEIYVALVRGRLHLQDVIHVNRRLCKPSAGSEAWRLAGARDEGREACTMLRGMAHGTFANQPCTLVELRPVTHLPQQLRLHCVAVGHPIVGEAVHDADRRLDWRFGSPLTAPRLMLHCSRLRVPLSAGAVDVEAPTTLCSLLKSSGLDEALPVLASRRGDADILFGDDALAGSTSSHRAHDAWESFAGGLQEDIIDDTYWDAPKQPRAIKFVQPYGPPEWDENASFLFSKKQRSQKPNA